MTTVSFQVQVRCVTPGSNYERWITLTVQPTGRIKEIQRDTSKVETYLEYTQTYEQAVMMPISFVDIFLGRQRTTNQTVTKTKTAWAPLDRCTAVAETIK